MHEKGLVFNAKIAVTTEEGVIEDQRFVQQNAQRDVWEYLNVKCILRATIL